LAAANQEYHHSQYRHEPHCLPILYSSGQLFLSSAPWFWLMCHGDQVRSVFFTYARLYAFSRRLMSPLTPSCMVKTNPVVVIGVDRLGVGRDNSFADTSSWSSRFGITPSAPDIVEWHHARCLVVRRRKRIGKEEPNVCTREQGHL
jgi:hypothetical protein